MKKKLLVLCSILLIMGCYKTEPRQEDELTVVKSTVETESVEVAGASYNPNVQGEEEEIEEVAEEPEVTVTIEEPSKEAVTAKPVYKKEKPSKYTKPVEPIKYVEPVEPEEEEIGAAIEEAIQDKIEEDKMVTKATPVTEVAEETSEEQETPKKSNTTLYAIIAAIAAAGAGIFFFNKK